MIWHHLRSVFHPRSPSFLVCNVELTSGVLKGLLWGLRKHLSRCFEPRCYAVLKGTIRSLDSFLLFRTFCYIIEVPFDLRLLSSSLLLGFSVCVGRPGWGRLLFKICNCHPSIWLSLMADGLSKGRPTKRGLALGYSYWTAVSLWTRLFCCIVLLNKRNSPVDSLAELVFL